MLFPMVIHLIMAGELPTGIHLLKFLPSPSCAVLSLQAFNMQALQGTPGPKGSIILLIKRCWAGMWLSW